jgi:predicted  nucleic acid-binding Zn-ribbon protein
MGVEDEMQNEVRRLEREIYILNEELEKLHKRLVQILMIKKKKEHDLHVLKSNSSEETYDKEFQTTLAKLLKGNM